MENVDELKVGRENDALLRIIIKRTFFSANDIVVSCIWADIIARICWKKQVGKKDWATETSNWFSRSR